MDIPKLIMTSELISYSLDGEPTLKRRASVNNKGGLSPTKKSPKAFKITKRVKQ